MTVTSYPRTPLAVFIDGNPYPDYLNTPWLAAARALNDPQPRKVFIGTTGVSGDTIVTVQFLQRDPVDPPSCYVNDLRPRGADDFREIRRACVMAEAVLSLAGELFTESSEEALLEWAGACAEHAIACAETWSHPFDGDDDSDDPVRLTDEQKQLVRDVTFAATEESIEEGCTAEAVIEAAWNAAGDEAAAAAGATDSPDFEWTTA